MVVFPDAESSALAEPLAVNEVVASAETFIPFILVSPVASILVSPVDFNEMFPPAEMVMSLGESNVIPLSSKVTVLLF
ncbi:hypothetical protein P4S64_13630 [Vibrio sp. M60_M31a]